MVIIEVTIVPIGIASTGLSEYVADLVKEFEQAQKQIKYPLTL